MTPIPEAVLAKTARDLERFSNEWREELPNRIHGRGLDEGGAPAWHQDFERWLCRDGVALHGDRWRTTQAFRQLRRIAPREFEVLYRVVALGESVSQVATWLNERAISGGHPERYSFKDSLVILISAVDKLDAWIFGSD
jgi:hypothetical protein